MEKFNKTTQENCEMSHSERLTDQIANFVGSWKFLIIQTVFFTIWVTMNIVAAVNHWDVYPFILLNLIISVQTAYTGPIILMAQNRESERDRLRHIAEYETDMESRLELEAHQHELLEDTNRKLEEVLKLLGNGVE